MSQSTSSEQAVAGHPTRGGLAAAIETLRPYQWLKSLLVFVPLLVTQRLGDLDLFVAALRTCVAFSLCASAIYVVNDIIDAPSDRHHPHKRFRPIASGRLSSVHAALMVPVLLGIALIATAPLDPWVTVALALYLVVMTAYSLRLKSIVLLDAFVLAAGYALRVVAGGVAVHIDPSAKLLAFCIFLFLSLALLKRFAELVLLRVHDGPGAHARSYRLEDQHLVMALGIASGVTSVLLFASFLESPALQPLYVREDFLWICCILLLYWVSHIWMAANRGRMTDDPLVFAIRDPVSRALILLMAVGAWAAT